MIQNQKRGVGLNRIDNCNPVSSGNGRHGSVSATAAAAVVVAMAVTSASGTGRSVVCGHVDIITLSSLLPFFPFCLGFVHYIVGIIFVVGDGGRRGRERDRCGTSQSFGMEKSVFGSRT